MAFIFSSALCCTIKGNLICFSMFFWFVRALWFCIVFTLQRVNTKWAKWMWTFSAILVVLLIQCSQTHEVDVNVLLSLCQVLRKWYVWWIDWNSRNWQIWMIFWINSTRPNTYYIHKRMTIFAFIRNTSNSCEEYKFISYLNASLYNARVCLGNVYSNDVCH